ncbi:MAG TPA: YraN family protein [Syntrophomonas sp.]|nr:YraN family protein [Syntrophomonas sp.]HPT69046.1 YraN family protein [Syntrophomonas sp.]
MKIALGRQGEEIAANYLQKQGYEILARNFRCRYGELDIICRKNAVIVFVEVKTRRSELFGSPEEAITRSKIEHIRKVALFYLAENKTHCRETRFDVISIMMKADQPDINHIEAAF